MVVNERQIEAEEILDLMAELMKGRVDILAKEPKCPPDAFESVHTLIWAASRTDIQELKIVRQQLILRYGEKWCEPALKGEGENCYINPDVKERLLLTAPPPDKCIETLVAIAAKNNVPFDPVRDLANSRIGLSSSSVVPKTGDGGGSDGTENSNGNNNHNGGGGTTVRPNTGTPTTDGNTTTTIVITSSNDGSEPKIQIQNPPLNPSSNSSTSTTTTTVQQPVVVNGNNSTTTTMTYLDPYTGQPMVPGGYPNPMMPNYSMNGNNNNNVPFPSNVPMALPMIPSSNNNGGGGPFQPHSMMMMPPSGYAPMTSPGYNYTGPGGNVGGNNGYGGPVQKPTVPSSSSSNFSTHPDDPNFGIVTKPHYNNNNGQNDAYPDGVPPSSNNDNAPPNSSSSTTTTTTITTTDDSSTVTVDSLQARLQALRASR